METKQNKMSVKWAAVTLGVLVAVIGASVALLPLWSKEKVTDYATCVAAGGAILDIYPQQCRIGDAMYTDETQPRPEYPKPDQDGSAYIGLTEEAALAKVKRENTPARVVERGGETLPITMDFAYGRHNLYIKDGRVYRVDIEGQATDAE